MDNKTFRMSRLAHVFEKDGVAALWQSLNLELVFVKEPFTTLIQQFRCGATAEKVLGQLSNVDERQSLETLISTLTRAEILVPVQHDEMAALQAARESALGVSIGILYLLLTDACNFRCKYCFIENTFSPSHKFSLMTRETAPAAIDFFATCIQRNPKGHHGKKTIIFYGGEPLMNKGVFLFALEHIRQLQKDERLPKHLSISLISNGSLIDEEIAGVIASRGVRVSISLDGPEEIHDEMRKNAHGGGTFTQALRGFTILREKGVAASVSCTIGTHNLERLPEIFEWFADHLGIRSLGFNILLETPGMTADAEYVRRANDQLIRCYEMARGRGIYEDRIMRKARAFATKKPHFLDCGGCGKQLVVAPDGRIGPCHAYLSTKKYFVGELDGDFDPFNDPTFIEWSKRSPLNMPQCFNCEALGICGGGCAYNAEMRHGSIWAVDTLFCIHSKETLRWLIWDLYGSTRTKKTQTEEVM